ncbi:unnamed protein product [Diamesa tonsa]
MQFYQVVDENFEESSTFYMDFKLPGAFMMIIGGVWFGWAYPATEINLNVDLLTFLNKLTFALSSWNLGVIFGAILGTFAVYQIDMLAIIFINSVLTTIAGILIIILPNEYSAIITSRILCGIAFGLSFLVFIIYSSEISSSKFRAINIWSLPFFFIIGNIMISFNSTSIYIGSITITTSVLSTVFGYFLVHNSPLQFLQKSKESEAYKSLAYFQQNTYQNPHIEIETLKAALVVENNRPLAIGKRHNTTSMLIILLLKIGYLAFFNIMFRSIRLLFTESLFTIDSNINLFRTPVTDTLYTVARLVGLVIGVVFITKLSHRSHYVISGLVSGGLIAILGIVLNISRAVTDFNPNYIQWIIFAVFLTAELFFGFGVAMVPDIILAEILPIREKRYSIASSPMDATHSLSRYRRLYS